MISVAVFRSEMQASQWLCFNKYQGTDIWGQEFPYLKNWKDVQNVMGRPRSRTNKGFKDINETLNNSAKEGIIHVHSPEFLVNEMKGTFDLFHIQSLDVYNKRTVYNKIEWSQRNEAAMISLESQDNGYCFLCHFTNGMMTIINSGEKVYPKGGLKLYCMCNYIDSWRGDRKPSSVADI